MVSSTGRINQAGWIILLSPRNHLFSFKLTPGFIKRHPHYNRRMRDAQIHNLFPFLIVVSDRFVASVFIGSAIIYMRLPTVSVIAARHILPNQDTFLITMIIPTCRFHLYVLTNHIETPVLGLFDIIQQCFVCWSCIQTIGPPTLVKRTILEIIFVVQLHTHNAVCISFC